MRNFPSSILLFFLMAIALIGCGRSDRFRVMDQSPGRGSIPLHAVVTDLDDQRERTVRDDTGLLRIPIIYLWITYHYDRHDDVYSNSTDPFNELVAKELAARLRDAKVFEKVTYVPSDRLPERGEYDVLVTGELNRLTRRGWKSYYGLSIAGQLIQRYIPFPHLSRWWDIEANFELRNAYDGVRLGEPTKVEYQTSSQLQSTFANFGPVDDLKTKLTPVLDELVNAIWEDHPSADDPSWASLRTEGVALLERERLEAERMRRGTPPTMNFISPSDGEIIRSGSVPLNWAITAPGGLKQITLVVNNQAIDAGVSPISLAVEETAPRSLPARNTDIPLQMGENKIEVLLLDHRGNQTTAEMKLVRHPRSLHPPNRHALLVGTDSSEAIASVSRLREVLTDPLLGQFDDANITTLSDERLNRGVFEGVIGNFGPRPLRGDLAFIHLAAAGNWENLTIAGGNMPLGDLVDVLNRSLATDDVVLLLDIDWEGDQPDTRLEQRLESLPIGWVILSANGAGERQRHQDGVTLLAHELDSLFTRRDGPATVTLEAMLDSLMGEIGGGVTVFGRYNPNLVMLERE
ncbi:MAG: hypothetical protein JJU11_12190 [Candidatus Sumerlaeia bacterium]|nr:hypothetical protein [Candidatus Sumerlaeia bacterium]